MAASIDRAGHTAGRHHGAGRGLCRGAARLVAVVALAVATTAGAQTVANPIVIKFSHVVAIDTPKGKGAELFKQLAEERAGGRVRVEVYSELHVVQGQGRAGSAAARGGPDARAVGLPSSGPLGVKEFEVFDLPYIFPNKAVLAAVTEGPIGASLFRKLDGKGIRASPTGTMASRT